ncbi:GNAT family N-acetyltransferase [Streptomyces sp. NPDC005303]|uniref:GNAT family N-acetyltransferase n=1 Tax=Streptomyces sp. NPDC005303 TaxID=3155713 RepID=UPI0033BD172A
MNHGSGHDPVEPPAGYVFQPYRGHEDHHAMAAVRLSCLERDRIDAHSVVEGLPTAAEIAESSAQLVDPSDNQVLVVHRGDVVGYTTVRWWRERDGTWLYRHRGYLLPDHRGRGVGSAMLRWVESRIHQLVGQQGTAQAAVFGANATTTEEDATALLLGSGYQRVFSVIELELADLGRLPKPGKQLPAGIILGSVGPSDYHAAWKTVVDSYADSASVPQWTFQDFLAEADATCWRAAWRGEHMVGVALSSIRRHDRTVGEVEELSVQAHWRRLGLGRALLLEGLRSLREQGAVSARLFTGSANPHRSYDLYESMGFQRRNEYVRYRKALHG